MNIGPWQLLIVALVILVLFGRGRISEMMGDFGKGIKSFKKGMTDDADKPAAPQIPQSAEKSESASATETSSASNSK